jgi:hypothetical protein
VGRRAGSGLDVLGLLYQMVQKIWARNSEKGKNTYRSLVGGLFSSQLLGRPDRWNNC